MRDLSQMKPAPGFDRVLYPGQDRKLIHQEYQRDGIAVADEVYDYLTSEMIHRDRYETEGAADDDTIRAKQLHRWKDDGGALPPPDPTS